VSATPTALLRVESVSKRFGRVVTATNVTFDVGAGQVLGVVGPNGAGKSTMLDMVNGTQRPDHGRILLDGRDVTTLDAAARSRRGIGRTYQIPRPFDGLTVFENVLVGARFAGGHRGRAAHQQALDAVELTGLGSLVNTDAAALRLLDRKRLELARALATSPRLILLDEIAGGLTEAELPDLITLITNLRAEGLGVIWIEHIVHALLQVVDRLMCLALGEIVAIGDPHQVMRSPEVVEVYLGSIPESGMR
jgi:branched-chain amino acid transport system ATP-binding protein